MALLVERIGDIAVVQLPYEELDATNVAEFKRELCPIVETEPRIILDLSRITFVDSSGLGAFLSCLRKVNERHGALKLAGLSRPVRAVFELVRMYRVFDIYATRDAAVLAFASASRAGAP